MPPSSAFEREVTPMPWIQAICRAYARRAKDPTLALQSANIIAADVANPQKAVSAKQMEAFSHFAMQELDDEALGWFSRRLPWGTYGMLCRASLTAPNLHLALKRWCRHHRLITDDITLNLNVQNERATLTLEENQPLGEFRELALLTVLRYVQGYASWLIDSRITSRSLHFPFAAPWHQKAYEPMFNCPVIFSAPNVSWSFDAHYLQLPPRRDETALTLMLKRALPLTVFNYRKDRLLGQRLRQLIGEKLQQGAQNARHLNAHTLASTLHVSVRSLYRHIEDEGESLQNIKNEMRMQQAKILLRQGRANMKHISEQSGFAHEKSFSRAFRQWQGVSPQEFRKQNHHATD